MSSTESFVSHHAVLNSERREPVEPVEHVPLVPTKLGSSQRNVFCVSDAVHKFLSRHPELHRTAAPWAEKLLVYRRGVTLYERSSLFLMRKIERFFTLVFGAWRSLPSGSRSALPC